MPATLLSRFLRYVRVDTQSSENSASTPSTPGQWVLLRMLEHELAVSQHGLLAEARLDSGQAG